MNKDKFKSIEEYVKMVADLPQVPPTWQEDKNCLTWWFPRIQGAGLPVPKTRIITTTVRLIDLLDNKTPDGFDNFLVAVTKAVEDVGYPAFLRTGQCSGKHRWDSCCFVASPDTEVGQHIFTLVEWSECVDFMGLPHHVWAVREYLPVEPLYHCRAYGNMPVVREVRVFVEDDRVAYMIPYWPKNALRDGNPSDPDWESRYEEDMGTIVDQALLSSLAGRAGKACGGRWSVDLLSTTDDWYVTDMAIAERSWGYEEDLF